jgi:hypothetical protein
VAAAAVETQEEELARLYQIPIPNKTDLPISYCQSEKQGRFSITTGSLEKQRFSQCLGVRVSTSSLGHKISLTRFSGPLLPDIRDPSDQ